MIQQPPSIVMTQFAHLASERLPNKMIQSLEDEHPRSLLGRALIKMREVKRTRPNIDPVLICPESDDALIQIAKYHEMFYLAMPTRSEAKQWPDLIKLPYIMDYLKSFDYVWDVNLACHPFLKVETLLQSLDRMLNCGGSSPTIFPKIAVTIHRETLWDERGRPLNSHGQLACTKTNDIFYKPTHTSHLFPRMYLDYDEMRLANSLVPVVVDMPKLELIDIDTQEDLDLARIIQRGMK